MYTSTIAIVGITSFIVQVFSKITCHCKESDCSCSCYDKIRQVLFPKSNPFRRMEPLAQQDKFQPIFANVRRHQSTPEHGFAPQLMGGASEVRVRA